MLTQNDPNGFKNNTNVYSIHLQLGMTLSCQMSTGKWKYVNPCLDFLGIPDQRNAGKCGPDGRTYVDQVHPRPDYQWATY